MTHDRSPATCPDDPLGDAIRHRRDTSDRARTAELRADILAKATSSTSTTLTTGTTSATSTDRSDGDPPAAIVRRRRGRLLLAAAAIVLVVAGIATFVAVSQRTAQATAQEVLIDAANATRAGGTARYEMSLPFEITFGTDHDAAPLARYDFGCEVDFDFAARGSTGRCETRRLEGPPLFDFLEDSYQVLILDGIAYERVSDDDPWVESVSSDPATPFATLFNLLDPVSTLDFFTGESADMDPGQVTRTPSTDTRRVETSVSVPFDNDIADAVFEADIVAVIDADDQVLRIEAVGAATTDVPFASRWPFELRIERTAVDIDVDLSLQQG